MNDTLKMYGSIGSEIMNRLDFVVAMCFKRQPRWRRLQAINTIVSVKLMLHETICNDDF